MPAASVGQDKLRTAAQGVPSTSSNIPATPLPLPIGGHGHPSDVHAHTGGHAASASSTPNHLHPASGSATTSASLESVFTEEEQLSDYEAGGYHPVMIGDVYGPDDRYVIVRKLGWGHFSTVWLARDSQVNRHVALKVVKSATHYTETALDEIKLLQRVVDSNPAHPGRRHVVSLLDHFTHRGPNGAHVCMVFEVLGENLLGLIKRYHHRGVPEHICKQIAKQVLLGLDYMHRECGIIHTDLKPENVLICIDDVEAVVRAELDTSPAAVPTKLVGVPPSQGRGGTQTPRSETVFITGSQPLPSPSSSYGTSPVIEKLAFQMSKISDSGSAPSGSLRDGGGGNGAQPPRPPGTLATADAVGEELGGVQIGDRIGIKTPGAPAVSHGPSLLSQQAPAPSQVPTPAPSTETAAPPTTTTTGGIGSFFSNLLSSAPGPAATEEQDVAMLSASVPPSVSGSAAASAAASPSPGALRDRKPSFPPSPPQLLPYNPLQPAPTAGDPTVLPPPAPYDPSTLERITVKIADLGNASWTDLHFTNDIQTRQYRSPEAILGAKWGTSVDVWSASAMFFELLTGDYLFDPHPGTRYNKDDDHIAQVIELMGPFPRSIALSGKFSSDIFTRRGELKHIHKLKFWPLHSVLQDKYLISEEEAMKLESFLQPMLNLNPDKRATAHAMLEHEWLGGVVVQGEIEAEEARMVRDGEVPGADSSRGTDVRMEVEKDGEANPPEDAKLGSLGLSTSVDVPVDSAGGISPAP